MIGIILMREVEKREEERFKVMKESVSAANTLKYLIVRFFFFCELSRSFRNGKEIIAFFVDSRGRDGQK